MKLAIVILNWNGLELLKKFIPSVVAFSQEHSIYLADNASTDDSVLWIQEHYPQIKVLPIPENRGYAGGYNYVVSQLSEDILCLLNSDVEVSSNWCTPVLHAFISDPNLGAAQPKILDYKSRDTFEYAGASGGFIDQLGYPYCRGRIFEHLEMDHGQYDYRMEIDWASGACFFVRRSAYEECDGFDTTYFAHQEEIDLCWRLRRMDYSVEVVPESQVYHLGGGTLNSINPQKTFLNFRNSLMTLVKNDLRWYWWMLLLLRMVLDGAAGVKFLFGMKPRHFMAILRAHFSFYRSFPSLLNQRKALLIKSEKAVKNKGVNSIVATYYLMGKKRFTEL